MKAPSEITDTTRAVLTAAYHTIFDVKDARHGNELTRVKAHAAHQALADFMEGIGVEVPRRFDNPVQPESDYTYDPGEPGTDERGYALHDGWVR